MVREYQNDSRPLDIESYPISDVSEFQIAERNLVFNITEFWINSNLRANRACRYKVAGPLTHLSKRNLQKAL